METEDKLYKKIQEAAKNAESNTFPGMEKVWARVEEKIETVAVVKSKFLWKKWAIAASFLLFMTIGYHFYNQNEPIDKTIDNTKEFSTPDTKIVLEEPNSSESEAPSLDYKNIDTVLKKQLEIQTVVAAPESKESKYPDEIQFKNNEEIVTYVKNAKSEVGNDKIMLEEITAPVISSNAKKTKENSIVSSGYATKRTANKIGNSSNDQQEIVNEDLVIINDKVSDYKTLNNLDSKALDSIVILTEPLYIINGVEYSEASLYGKNPTSPYAPLSKQKITKTKILSKEEAVKTYGEKGKKGVIIIETKKGKPLKQ